MSLFENKSFTSHSGLSLSFKINCDALSNDDIETLASIIAKNFSFSKVYGIPRGGLRLAKALEKYLSLKGPLLIVDDVLTTGKSMEAAKEVLGDKNAIGAVIFTRGKCPIWIRTLFMQASWAD